MCARWPALAVALAAVVHAPAPLLAEEPDAPAKTAPAMPPARLDMTLTTLALTAPVLLEGEQMQIAPVYEQVRLSASNLKAPLVDSLALHVSGWTSLNAGELAGGQRIGGDFAYAYAEGTVLERRVQVRAGRQLVTGGVARVMSIDGLRLVVQPSKTWGLNAYSGLRVLPGFAHERSDSVYGARAHWRPRYGTEVGASYLLQYEGGRLGRNDVGLDGRWQPRADVAAQAAAIFSLYESRLAEGIFGVDYRPTETLQLWGGLRRTSPDLFLSRASIFSVFSMEETDEVTGEASWTPMRRLRVRADWAELWTSGGGGRRTGGRVTGNPLAADPLLLGLELRRLALPARGYWQARVFGSRRIGERLFVTADVDAYFLDVALNGQTQALTAVATGGMEVRQGLRLMVAALAGSTPYFSSRYEFTARLAWDLSYSGEVAQ